MSDNASRLPHDNASQVSDDAASLVRVASSFHEWEALLLVQRLREDGVMATATGTYTAGFLAEAPGLVSVYIKDRDVERAREVMERLVQEQQPRGMGDDSGSASSTVATQCVSDEEDEIMQGPRGVMGSLRDGRLVALLFGATTAIWLLVVSPWPATLVIIGLTAIIICLSVWLRRRIV